MKNYFYQNIGYGDFKINDMTINQYIKERKKEIAMYFNFPFFIFF